ncbi:cytochrome P450 [Linderina pennispora]|uniref:Cytochrome P450 n=1 Tax=Linderina pennispora TaxID=61395 RepID=A0A1Y1WGT7_9FUNG|nr:cytochrome P450 [Linderina pennispora]ORX72344.1 cytochrome P450 [Linderina pennispora]
MLSSCPVSHELSPLFGDNDASSKVECHFSIVVEKGKRPDKDGFIVSVSAADTDLAMLRANIAQRSTGITMLPEAVAFEDEEGNEIVSIDQVQRARVVYLTTPIAGLEAPVVRGYPIFGIAPMLFSDMRQQSISYFDRYGDTFSYYLLGVKGYYTRDLAVTNATINDSEYFEKSMGYPWSELHELGGNGLITSSSDDPDWKLAHRLLVPAFSASAMNVYGHKMAEISEQACEWLDSHIGEPIEMFNFATSVTFQIIARIGFGFDFNLLDPAGTGQHPFTEGMDYCLKQMLVRFILTPLWKYLPIAANRKFAEHMRNMRATVQQVIDERRTSPDAASMKKDLLGFMLNARAPNEDGNLVGLSDRLIQEEIITFGIAGTETSSSTISFALQLLDKHRDVQHRALQELAAAGITADTPPTIQQTNKLTYLTQIINETLRLFPPVPVLLRKCKKDYILPGGIIIRKGDQLRIYVWGLHRDPKVFPDPLKFDPNRFSPENIKNIKPGSWVPFVSGSRACLGRQFAMMELRAVLARLLSRYEFHVVGNDEPRYHPAKLTTSPMNLFMTVQKRTSLPDANTPIATDAGGNNDNYTVEHPALHPLTHTVSADKLPRTFVVYGSNMGTSEDYATQITGQLRRMGFADITLLPLDDWDFASMQSADGRRSLVVAITSTYNGMPPDNARNFAKLLDQGTRTDILKDVDFVLFGCGNSLWHTFLKFPRHLYQRFVELGATPLTEFTAGDSNDDLDDEFMKWSLQVGMIVTGHYSSSVDAYIDVATSMLSEN